MLFIIFWLCQSSYCTSFQWSHTVKYHIPACYTSSKLLSQKCFQHSHAYLISNAWTGSLIFAYLERIVQNLAITHADYVYPLYAFITVCLSQHQNFWDLILKKIRIAVHPCSALQWLCCIWPSLHAPTSLHCCTLLEVWKNTASKAGLTV